MLTHTSNGYWHQLTSNGHLLVAGVLDVIKFSIWQSGEHKSKNGSDLEKLKEEIKNLKEELSVAEIEVANVCSNYVHVIVIFKFNLE